MEHSKYIIGIDLGTTNCAATFIDTSRKNRRIEKLYIPQRDANGDRREYDTLPSFCYLDDSGTIFDSIKHSLGVYAREEGCRLPGKFVCSAKSWLCNNSVDRTAPLLPLDGESGSKISPLEASRYYLEYIRLTWDSKYLQDPFEDQEVVVTIPASFDDMARSLTLRAAKLAGYKTMTLLEEPQAAFYSWIDNNESSWQGDLEAGDNILVCDIGGGTTDFSLIQVEQRGGDKGFQRTAVGDHLLLGGDNLDLAIAYYLKESLGGELSPGRWLQVQQQARYAKEHLLSGSAEYHFTLQGSGSSLVGGSLAGSIKSDELDGILKGFWGDYEYESAVSFALKSGVRAIGLNYESEPSIIRHMARFLKNNSVQKLDYILFNGGTMKASRFKTSMLDNLERWFGSETKVLYNKDLDLSVSRGAAYYGMVRRGLGVRVVSGVPRSYYLEFEDKIGERAVTILPKGSEEDVELELEHAFNLQPNLPVNFQLYYSNSRQGDSFNDIIELDMENMQPLPTMQTILKYGKGRTDSKIPVRLEISYTNIGVLSLALSAIDSAHRWQLDFQLRKATGQEDSLSMLSDNSGVVEDIVEDSVILRANKIISEGFSEESSLKTVIPGLEELFCKKRWEWSPRVLRSLWPALISSGANCKKSQLIESRWWNLAGFLLRPGLGVQLDDFKMKELWKELLRPLKYNKGDSAVQQNICLRRISGGLSRGQQNQLAKPLLKSLLDDRGKIAAKNKSQEYFYAEAVRALAAMERLEVKVKVRLANAILERIVKSRGHSYDYWSLSRLVARNMLYAGVGHVLPPDVVAGWVRGLIKASVAHHLSLDFFISVARKTEFIELNLSTEIISEIHKYFEGYPEAEHLHKILDNTEALSSAEMESAFGDKLPIGIELVH